MSKKKTTFVSLLLDETGSMEPMKDDTVGGLNAYVDTLKEAKGEILFSLVSFNSSETRRRYVAEPIRNVKRLRSRDYQPRAMTPLIDATVKIIKATDDAVAKRDDDPNVVIVVQTDGAENVSVEYTAAQLAWLVRKKERAGWQFVFLGAGLDAFEVARDAGMVIDTRHMISYGRDRSRKVFSAMADNVSNYAASGRPESLHFSEAQRDEAGDEHTRKHLGSDGPADEHSSTSAMQSKKRRKWYQPPADDVSGSTADDYSL